ncbi:hypothetical protein FLBR109950_04865 [Flavobacterium branchiophilum]|uniref:MetA-pathway of phenol degradation n=1 Tax=Flavobacterium branchiophilum (strain FL-15) TaxID=1034807 RepID=G2Z1Q7_FLABF|nr:hypothetical protein [Flavobacterium branchiophilum]CCB69839.1 Protein of unknown function precursor [Flavobacterium branchiophilum FL-15]
MTKFILKFTLILVFITPKYFAQGSGDQGVTSMGSIVPSNSFQNDEHFVSVDLGYATGKNNVTLISQSFTYSNNFQENFATQFRLKTSYTSGVLAKVFTLNEINFNSDYHLNKNGDFISDINFGTLITLNFAKKEVENPANGKKTILPMEYQGNRGTLDIFVGYTFANDYFNASFGYIQPLTIRNRNYFFPSYWGLGLDKNNPEDQAIVSNYYHATNEIKYSSDFYTRLGYKVINTSDMFLNLGITGFYRLRNDRYNNTNNGTNPYYPGNGYHDVEGTKGLSANGVVQFNYQLKDQIEIRVYAGVPIVKKDLYTDSLERKFFITPSLIWKLN